MKKLLFILVATSLLFFSCEKESGELFDDSLSNPAYSADIIETVWSSSVDFSTEFETFISSATSTNNMLLLRSSKKTYAYASNDGEFLWSIDNIYDQSKRQLETTTLEDRIFFYSFIDRRNSLLGFNTNTGVLEDIIYFDEFPDIVGSISKYTFFESSIYLVTYMPNQTIDDLDDFSLFIYEYNIKTNEVSLIFQNEQVFKPYFEEIPELVINYDGTAIYYPYFEKLDKNVFKIEIVEIPFDGQQEKVVVQDVININFLIGLRANTFAVQGNHLILNYSSGVENSLRAYNLNRNGELLWKRNSSLIPQFYMGNLYLIQVTNSGPLIQVDIKTGSNLWRYNGSVSLDLFTFINGKPLAAEITFGIKNISILDLNTGNSLINLSIEDLGVLRPDDTFVRRAHSFNNGEELIVITREGELFSLKLPF